MIPNIKFYVILVVSIFAALGIGVYIGFILDVQDLVADQRTEIVSEIEDRFDFLSEENSELRQSLDKIKLTNSKYEYFIESTHEEIIKDKLKDINVAIIETNSDYMYSGTGQVLDMAGAKLTNVTTITDKLMNEDLLVELYNKLEIPIPEDNIIKNTIENLAQVILSGETNELINELNNEGFIEVVGPINEPIKYVIVAGGSLVDPGERIKLIDNTIIDISREMLVPVIGIEKSEANYSYMGAYKEFNITTIDNIDTIIGKVALVLAMEGRPGHYGLKETAEDLVPESNIPLVEYFEERQ